jgi:hypothetical protein
MGMKKFAIMSLAVGAFALTFVSLVPQPADAGWRRRAARGWGPGVTVQVEPRYGYYAPRRTYGRAYRRPKAYPYAYYPYWRGRYYRGWY